LLVRNPHEIVFSEKSHKILVMHVRNKSHCIGYNS